MKKINQKYLAAAILMGGAAVLPLAGSASATGPTANVPVNLTAAASSIDVIISTTEVNMSVAAGKTDAEVNDLTVKNGSAALPVYVSEIILDTDKATDGFTNELYSSTFSAFNIDSKKYGLAITKAGETAVNANNDLKTGYTGDKSRDKVAANGSITYELSGKSSAYSTALSKTKIGELTVTIAASQN